MSREFTFLYLFNLVHQVVIYLVVLYRVLFWRLWSCGGV